MEYNPVIEVNMIKRINKNYPDKFKQEAVALMLEQNYTILEAAASIRHH